MDTDRRKLIRNKLIVACYGSSGVGTVGVVWFFLAAFNLTMTHFWQVFPAAVLVFVLDASGQFIFNEILLKNFFSWIEDPDFRKNPKNTRAALVEILWFPFRGSAISLCFWFSTAFIIGGYLHLYGDDFSPRQILTIIIATIGGGFISLSFQYAFYKKIFRTNCVDLMSADTEFLRKQGTTLLNARTKWLSGMLILLSVGMVYVYFMGNNRAAESIMRRSSQLTAKVGRHVMTMAASGESAESINAYLNDAWNQMDQQVFIFDGQGVVVYGTMPAELNSDIIKKILAEYQNFLARAIRTEEYFSRNIPGSSDEFYWIRMDDKLSVGSVFYRGVANGVLGGFNVSVSLLALFFLFIATFVAYFAASDISDPMAVMLDLAEKISRGDLTQNVNLISEDEIGRLAAGLQVMIEELRGMMGRVNQAADQVDRAAYNIMESQSQVADSAGKQTAAIEDASALAGDLDKIVNQISENIEVMAESARASAKTIIDIESLSHELSENIGELGGAVETTTSAIYEMNASVKEINEGAEVLNKVAEDTASSTLQMNQAIKEVEDNARETLTISDTVNQDAIKGVASVQSTINGIGKIEENVREATEVITRLGRQAEEIGQIVSVITDIADQTNLLALNAAIIAAQAGERGRSFAVVADEIKKLSERTTRSTKEIRELIASVQGETQRAVAVMVVESKSVEDGVNLAFQAGQALEKIQKSAKKSSEMAQQISSATTQQATTSKRVTEAISAIADRVTQISTAIREQSRGAEQITRASGEMREIAPMVRMKAQKQADGGKQITSAMENIKEMVNYVLKSQQKQQEQSERIAISMNQIRTILKANTETVSRLSATVGVLSKQSDNLKTEVGRFKLPS